MNAWIKVDMITPDKPEVVCIAGVLGIDQDAVMGKLLRIWIWADQNSIAGDNIAVTARFIDRLTGKRGFAAAMREAGWLAGEDGALSFPGFDRHNGTSAKARDASARRMAKSRQAKATAPVELIAPLLPLAPENAAAPIIPPTQAAPAKVITLAPAPELTESKSRHSYPPALGASAEFVTTWETRWLPYLQQRTPNRAPTIQTLDSQLATCLKLGPAMACAAIISAIEKGWAAPDLNAKAPAPISRPSESPEPDDWKAYWRNTYPPEDFPDAPRYENGAWKEVRNDHKREIITALTRTKRRSA